MSIPDWHTDLPDYLLIEGYGETLPNNLIRSEMDTGPAKVRRRNTAGAYQVSGQQYLTAAQLSTLKTFYQSTLLDGSLRFAWTDPLDSETAVEMRFVEPPTWTKVEGYILVTYTFEVLPS